MRIANNANKLIATLALFVISVFAITPVYAVGVSVTPAQVNIQAHVGEESVARIKVANPSKDVVLFEVYPDDLENLVSAAPSSFTLESGEEKEVLVKVRAEEEGQFLTTLSVVGRLMADSKFQAGSGVKIPVTITVDAGVSGLASAFETLTAGPWLGWLALTFLVAWLGYKFWRKTITPPASS